MRELRELFHTNVLTVEKYYSGTRGFWTLFFTGARANLGGRTREPDELAALFPRWKFI